MADKTTERVLELMGKWQRLKQWGVGKKVPFTKETQADIERFFADVRAGKLDVSEITSVTSDIRKLERYAEEYDTKAKASDAFRQEPMKTTFDIENASEPLQMAKSIVDKAADTKAFARDAAKEGVSSLSDAAKVIPWWAWAGGALALGTFILSQLAAVSRAFGHRDP